MDIVSLFKNVGKRFKLNNYEIYFKIRNCVIKGKYSQELHLVRLFRKLIFFKPSLNQRAFKSFNISIGRKVMLLYLSGIFVTAGSQSYFTFCHYQLYLLNILRAIASYQDIKLVSLETKNIVLTIDLQHFVKLEQLVEENASRCYYDKTVFPGATYRPFEEKDKKTAVLIFETGRIVLVGINSNEDFNAFTEIFFDFIKNYVSETRCTKLESDEKEEFQIQN